MAKYDAQGALEWVTPGGSFLPDKTPDAVEPVGGGVVVAGTARVRDGPL